MKSKIMRQFWLVLLAGCLLSCGGSGAGNSPTGEQISLDTTTMRSPKQNRKHIIFFGNSLTAAYQLEPSQGYVALLQERLDSLGLPWQALNAGLSGETSAGGNERIDWVLRQTAAIFLLELGGNDALRGIPPSVTFQNLDSILTKVRARYADAQLIIAGMEAPPNMGLDYTQAFRSIFPHLAAKHNAALIPFFLDGVGGVPELNLPDGMHPNAKGQYVLRDNVWAVLAPLIAAGGEF